MDFKEYIHAIDQLYHVGNTTEHSFRGALASYLQSLLKNFVVTNEPRRIDCGAPDYVITHKNVPVAFLEAKDVNDGDLDGRKQHKDQFNRYKSSLDRIIFTDYLDFHLYVGGEYQDAVRIAETRGDHIVGIPENEAKFSGMVLHLATEGRQRITSSSALAQQMAAKAHLLADAVKKSIAIDGEDGDSDIAAQLRAFRSVLIHDLKPEEFADIYAQTIVYGLFTARLNDQTPEDFSRQEAAELIPKSNPFLRKIFQSIAVYDLDESIAWIVEDLASMFTATDAERIMKNYGGNKRHNDPIVHFYEDFLAEYDPKLRKARGVWYTPAPVVKFIVSSIDEILQTEFNLPMGLADDSTIMIKRAIQQSKDGRTTDGMKHEMVPAHRVQILDPATGTGTFLAEIIQQIRDKFEGMEGVWPSYVEKSLIPRLHGFEILMASYTIAHLKLSLTLKATGYEGTSNDRLNVFLTNSLEEASPRTADLFAKWLSDEADEASRVKAEVPVMIFLGNPPYSGKSSNTGDWIGELMKDYKKEPGGKIGLKERNPKWINNDYVKFIRLGQYFIDKNGEGVIAFINPHGYLDNPTFRGMRWTLLSTFDKIYTLNLHGSALRKETCPDGSKDDNVFDIQEGVSINILIKSGVKKKTELGTVYYADLYGTRKYKYDYLDTHHIGNVPYEIVSPVDPQFYFVPRDYSAQRDYEKGFKVEDLFPENTMGITTGCDGELVSFTPFTTPYSMKYCYRPFDTQWVNYDTSLLARPREKIMTHLQRPNTALNLIKINSSSDGLFKVFVTNGMTDKTLLSSKDNVNVFPLYLYNQDGSKTANLGEGIIQKFVSLIGQAVDPESIFDYVYAVLHSSRYRDIFKDFLKSELPRVPYPTDKDQYHRLVALGAELRKLHLLEGAQNWERRITFPVPGENIVEAIRYDQGKVLINDTQYFGGVSELAWNFFIGGYQPAQKWLKDRRGRKLDYKDILHYGHIIYALEETDRIMKEIDPVLFP